MKNFSIQKIQNIRIQKLQDVLNGKFDFEQPDIETKFFEFLNSLSDEEIIVLFKKVKNRNMAFQKIVSINNVNQGNLSQYVKGNRKTKKYRDCIIISIFSYFKCSDNGYPHQNNVLYFNNGMSNKMFEKICKNCRLRKNEYSFSKTQFKKKCSICKMCVEKNRAKITNNQKSNPKNEPKQDLVFDSKPEPNLTSANNEQSKIDTPVCCVLQTIQMGPQPQPQLICSFCKKLFYGFLLKRYNNFFICDMCEILRGYKTQNFWS